MRFDSVINLVEEAVHSLVSVNWSQLFSGKKVKEPLVCFGIAPGSGAGDYKLAIRSSLSRGFSVPCVEDVVRKTKGEVDMSLTGIIRGPRRVARTQNVAFTEMHERMRPLSAGYSVGHYSITCGTLGCFVQNKKGVFILSNNHVLACSNAANIGDDILQPGKHDGGRRPEDVVGKLVAFKTIEKEGNIMDAAIASVDKKYLPTNFKLPKIGKIKEGSVSPKDILGKQVQKVGRTTGHQVGIVTAINLRGVRVGYGADDVRSFDNMIEVRNATQFSAGGDSGSFVCDMGNHPVALLFAGGPSNTIVCPIDPILKEFGVKIVT